MASDVQKSYLPAAGTNWALPLYDPLVKLLGVDRARKSLLIQADLRPGYRVLDIGCGTGTLAATIASHYPGVEVVGLDPDPKALGRAEQKARRAGLSIRFDRGYSQDLPYSDASFDRVFSSMMFHHLPAGARERTLDEARRVLKPAGSFHMLDFEGPEDQKPGSLARFLHSSNHLKHNSSQRLLALLNQAGFADPKKLMRGSMLFGLFHIAWYKASVH